MRTYLISYELANPNAKKHAVAETIMELGLRWARALDNIWYVTAAESAEEIEARLGWMMGDDDALVIQAVDDPAVLTNTSLRWFRRRGAQTELPEGENILAFAQSGGRSAGGQGSRAGAAAEAA